MSLYMTFGEKSSLWKWKSDIWHLVGIKNVYKELAALFLVLGPIWRNRAPRSTRKSRSTGTCTENKASFCKSIYSVHYAAQVLKYKIQNEQL